MKRNMLKKLLQNYCPQAAEEIRFKQDILHFIDAHEDCFERSLAKGHVTGSAWLLNRDKSCALLTHHAKLDRWFQLGGHCDGDHDVLRVATREAQEESGITHIIPVSTGIFDIDVHLIPDIKKEPAHYHYDVRFLLQVASDEAIQKSDESKALRWVGKNRDDLPTNHPAVIRMFNKWVVGNF